MDIPERDELVVVKVVKVLDYGVFVELLEFNNMKGFIHISNVSSSWVKNIRNLVKMNQVRVAKVVNINEERDQIDLSFARVSPQIDKQKMTEFKQINREEKLIEILAKQEKKKFNDVWTEVAEPLIEEYGSLHKAFEKVALGQDISKIIPKNWVDAVNEMVEKNIVVSIKTLKGTATAKCPENNGLGKIKEVFSEVESVKGCSVIYNGAGTYQLTCSAPTYKEAERVMKNSVEKAEKTAKKNSVKFSFKQDNEKQKK